MSKQNNLMNEEDLIKIRAYITENYPPLEKDRDEDEIMQQIDELEEKSVLSRPNDASLSVMTSLPPAERVLVTINEMAKIIGIGHNSIRRMVRENPDATYIHRIGTRVYIKREIFTKIILEQSTIWKLI